MQMQATTLEELNGNNFFTKNIPPMQVVGQLDLD